VTFPSDYEISARAVLKAFRRALAAGVELAVDELRTVAHGRLETLYLATQGGVARGNPEAVRAAVTVVREHARLFGYAVPDRDPFEAARQAHDLQLQQEREEQMALGRAMTQEERVLFLDLCERARTPRASQTTAKTDPVTSES
jgi:hypothetical protein